MENKFKCDVFLKDETDRKLLKPGTCLYGTINKKSKRVFITPYKPPDDCLKLTGIVQPDSSIEKHSPLLINLVISTNHARASGYIDNEYMHLPVRFIYKSAGYERTPFDKSEMDLLWNSKVTVFGAGTGGSKIALELVRAGVGNLTLCDPDRLEYANISRHEGNLFDVGKPKVQLVAEKCYKINPAVSVKCYFEDIFERPFTETENILKGSDLVVAATDKTSVQLMINDFTRKLEIPAVFGGCYEQALAGEVFFTLPGKKMPCLSCLRSGLKQPEKLGNIDYSTAKGPEDYQGQPGLHASVDFITNVEVLICLGVLLKESKTSKLARMIDPDRNLLLIGGALAKGFYRFKKPFDIFYQPLKGPRKTCHLCQPNRKCKES